MNIIEKIKSKTSKSNRKKGQISTVIASVCVGVLATGLIVNPIGIIALTIGGIIFGNDARKRALKTTEQELDEPSK